MFLPVLLAKANLRTVWQNQFQISILNAENQNQFQLAFTFLNTDVFEHPSLQLASQHPIWRDMTHHTVQWKGDCMLMSVVNNVSTFVVSAQLLDRSRMLSVVLCACNQRQDHEPQCQLVLSSDKV